MNFRCLPGAALLTRAKALVPLHVLVSPSYYAECTERTRKSAQRVSSVRSAAMCSVPCAGAGRGDGWGPTVLTGRRVSAQGKARAGTFAKVILTWGLFLK